MIKINVEVMAAILASLAVAMPGVVRVAPASKNDLREVVCRTGIKYVSGEERGIIGKKLVQAGLEDKVSPEYFTGARIALCIIYIAMCIPLILAGTDAFWLLLLAPIVWYVPMMWLNKQITVRKSKIRLSVSEYSVYLSTAVSAGADPVSSIRVAAQNVNDPLKSEFERALKESNLGTELTEALHDMSERCDVDELRGLLRTISQSYRHGVAMAETIREYAVQMRSVRRLELMDAAGKLTIRMLLPVIIFMLGPCMAVVLYPVAISLFKMF